MKTLLALSLALSALAGCAVVPVEPVGYAPPPAVVVVHPRPYYAYRAPYWRRGWY